MTEAPEEERNVDLTNGLEIFPFNPSALDIFMLMLRIQDLFYNFYLNAY
jgi:hypothetical protein